MGIFPAHGVVLLRDFGSITRMPILSAQEGAVTVVGPSFFMRMISNCFCQDCMAAMKAFPDKFFDIAVVDPPYGGGASQIIHVEREREREREPGPRLRGGAADFEQRPRSRFGGRFDRYHICQPDGRRMGCEDKKTTQGADIRHWDIAPPKEYFDELARVSKNQIIWGGNYFDLPPTRCFIIWRKLNIPIEGFSMSPVEYAWTSFNENATLFEAYSNAQAGSRRRIHPTQKPVSLYAWIYGKYAQPGYKVLDTHLGSGSSRIAAYDAGLDFWGYEIDKTYFDLQEERFAEHTAQTNLFLMQEG